MQSISEFLDDEFKKLASLKEGEQKLYLVGGVVRDYCLNHQNKDIDVLCDFDTRIIARKFADLNHGSFFMLDGERNTSRVIVPALDGKKVYDFARMNGGEILADLALRDFTINAMAVDIDQPEKIIDPMGGCGDLKAGILRDCSVDSFSADPVRVIRAIRYSISHHLKIEAGTQERLCKAVPLLTRISGERKRDELFKIFDTDKPDEGVVLLWHFGILNELDFPQIANFETIKERIYSLSHVFSSISQRNRSKSNVNSPLIFELGLEENTLVKLHDYLRSRNSSERNEKQLILLGGIIRPVGENEAAAMASRMLLSREESMKLGIIVTNSKLEEIAKSNILPGDRELYHYYRITGEAGIDLALMMLADHVDLDSEQSEQKSREFISALCQKVIAFWYEKPEVANPIMLLNGNDLMMSFDLTPGPLVGELINKLREEQAAGVINNRKQALEWVENQLSKRSLKNPWDL